MSAFGTKRTFRSHSVMTAFGGKADIEDLLLPQCVFGSWLMVSCHARASADEEKPFNDRLLDQLPFDTG